MQNNESFPATRLRRLRGSAPLRRLVRETRLSLDQFIMPYFVREGRGIVEPIEAMPGISRFSPDSLLPELEELVEAGIHSMILFGIPDLKDEKASQAWSREGIIQKTLRAVKKQFPDLLVITDICLCAYTRHGHCGLVNEKGEIDNDSSIRLLADVALSHAEAGADLVAPSDMMDGRVKAIRSALDVKGFQNLPVMSYAAKYASAFYGPFREAAHSAPASGDRKTYQMDPANRKEAMREISLDLAEGADIIMVKPALAYLDIIREASQKFDVPIAAYSVSGEYSMIKAASEKGMVDERNMVMETMTSLARAGAGIFLTYYAKQIALWNNEPGFALTSLVSNS
ncbi:MAG: porphobilinogen synthase [Candidatus Omnitrophica bacterium]|nr:porphobilinogen synthase [Candidatus Omnitrophota bacterium]